MFQVSVFQFRSLPLAGLWLLVVLAAAALIVSSGDNLKVDTSIMSLLPRGSERALVEKSVSRLSSGFSNSLVFVVGAALQDRAEVSKAAGALRDSLAESGKFESVRTDAGDASWSEMVAPYLEHRYDLLDAKTRALIADGKSHAAVDVAMRDLFGAFAVPRQIPIDQDPFNLIGLWLARNDWPQRLRRDEAGAYAEADDRFYRVVYAEFRGDAFDLGVQRDVAAAVEGALNSSGLADTRRFEVLRSGLLFHAAVGADMARTEISTIGAGSVAGILLLLIYLFGRLRVLVIALVPIATGCMIAVAACITLLDRVHIITFVFGASLVGVSVDYILHYLCAQGTPSNGDDKRGVFILPALALSLLSSVVAYSSFALTPFPGLRQMALFAVVGLVATWTTVVLWTPFFAAIDPQTIRKRIDTLDRIRGNLRFQSVRMAGAVVVLAVLIIGLSLPGLETEDDIRILNTSPALLLAQERSVQRILKTPVPGRFLLVEGESLQEILEREEELRRLLDDAVASGQLGAYTAVSTLLPSIRNQRESYGAIARLYEEDAGLPSLAKAIQLSDQQVAAIRQDFELAAGHHLTYPKWQSTKVGRLGDRLLTIGENGSVEASTVLLHGHMSVTYLKEIADQHPGIRFVDYPDSISTLLGQYREQVATWLVLAYLLAGLLLAWRLRWKALIVVTAPGLATLLTLGCLSVMDQPITLFHMLAAVLVLGIGLDMGIFLVECRAASHALLAVAASSLSTLLAFGLLVLSETQVLHFFGQMAALGILLCLGISVSFVPVYGRKES